MEKFAYSWSSGKDSALGLYEMNTSEGSWPAYLISTVTEDYGRVSMHGVRSALLEDQADSLGIPLRVVNIPARCTNEIYEEIMEKQMQVFFAAGIRKVAFADIYLTDLRRYREDNLARLGMEAVFPLWGRNTAELARRFVELGFKSVITCVDGQVLDGEFAGKEFDHAFIDSLPLRVDPCGENGEFHTFVYDGPIFSRPVRFSRAEVVKRDGRFFFQELVPGAKAEEQAIRERPESALAGSGRAKGG